MVTCPLETMTLPFPVLGRGVGQRMFLSCVTLKSVGAFPSTTKLLFGPAACFQSLAKVIQTSNRKEILGNLIEGLLPFQGKLTHQIGNTYLGDLLRGFQDIDVDSKIGGRTRGICCCLDASGGFFVCQSFACPIEEIV